MMLTARKYLLLPLSLIWAGILKARHALYDKEILKSYSPKVKTICVGNLAFGGTGKTPFIEYLIREKIEEKYRHIAVISRGYGRKNKDLIFVKPNHSAEDVGDEPLQIKKKFGNKINVVVCADRQKAVEALLLEKPFTELILFDDAFQHRKIKANENVLLSTFEKPFWKDTLFPSGTLRDVKSRAKAAHEIVITKCPADLTKQEAKEFIKDFQSENKRIDCRFSKIVYQKPINASSKREKELESFDEYLLLTGIANADSLEKYLKEKNIKFKALRFPDHHYYSSADIEKIKTEFAALSNTKKAILTTEKDAFRLGLINIEILSFNLEILYLPIIFEMMFE